MSSLFSDECLAILAKGGFCDGNAVATIAELAAELQELRKELHEHAGIPPTKSDH